MDEHFTNNAETTYLASVTQAKKILFLQRQLTNSQSYCKTLQQNLQATKLTINRLIKERTNNEVLAKMSQNLYGMQRRYRELQQLLKQNNGKLLIQMQLRIQEKAEYCEKVKQLQQSIQLIRKTNKDKQQQFAIVVNKLRKYEDIRELMLEDKIVSQTGSNRDGRDVRKMLQLNEQDKEAIIKSLSQQLNFYKQFTKSIRADVDCKISAILFAIQNQRNFKSLKEQLSKLLKSGMGVSQYEKFTRDNITKFRMVSDESNKIRTGVSSSEPSNVTKLNQCTKQLVKQLKKLVISNKILESALNQSVQKNQELVLNNQILSESNIELKQELNEYKKREKSTICRGKQKTTNFVSKTSQSLIFSRQENTERWSKRQMKRTQSNHTLDKNSRNNNFTNEVVQVQDDYAIDRDRYAEIPQMVRQRKLKQYLISLKSQFYQVNVQSLYKDVSRISQFLILSLGNRSKDLDLDKNQRPTYASIMQRSINKMRSKGSISVDMKNSQVIKKKDNRTSMLYLPINKMKSSNITPQPQDEGKQKEKNMRRSSTGLFYNMNRNKNQKNEVEKEAEQEIQIDLDDSQELKRREQQMHIEQY